MTIHQPAPDGSAFSPDAFDSQIGKEIPVNIGQPTPARGRILSAVVASDGGSVEIELDMPGVPAPVYPVGSFSLADRE